jgi:hypothetical protein
MPHLPALRGIFDLHCREIRGRIYSFTLGRLGSEALSTFAQLKSKLHEPVHAIVKEHVLESRFMHWIGLKSEEVALTGTVTAPEAGH